MRLSRHGESFANGSHRSIWRKGVAAPSRSGEINPVRTRSSEMSEAAKRAWPAAYRSENRPFVRNSPVSRATLGDTNIPRWLTGSVM